MGQCPIPVSKIYVTLSCVLLFVVGIVLGQEMKCSGYCTKDTIKCQLRGGKIIGYCSKSLMCCDPLVSATASCGDKKSGQKVVFFKSPSFPEYAGGDLLCDLKVRIRNDTVAIRIDFLEVEMDGLSFDGSGENSASCESDMIFIRGFQTWSPPARCGNLTGYGLLINMDTRQTQNLGVLSVVALMSSPKYRFHMRISQTTKNSGVIWDVKESFISKRSAPKQRFPTIRPIKRPINSEIPITSTHNSIYDETYADSRYPRKWKSPQIVNGEDTLISTVPWQVSLRIKYPEIMINNSNFMQQQMTSTTTTTDSTLDMSVEDMTMENDTYTSNCSISEGIHFCGGSIFGDGRHVLSAAHCFFGSSKLEGMVNISSIMVVVGDTDKCSADDEELGIFTDQGPRLKSYKYSVESIVFHYGYDHSLLINDVAILRLNESIKYYDHIKPITLAGPGDNFVGNQATVSGWGDRSTEGNSNNSSMDEIQGPNILQSTKLLEIQNTSFCNQREISQFAGPKAQVLTHAKYMYVFDSTICTLTKNGSMVEVNVGSGDSGGPLITYVNETSPVLVGIVSYSIPYDEKVLLFDGVNRTVDFFTSIPFYRSWIDLAVESFQQSGEKQS